MLYVRTLIAVVYWHTTKPFRVKKTICNANSRIFLKTCILYVIDQIPQR